uniref:Uncharacterized protein n=1 Tax=viral metagenome TaxID=1070528 RepID=A0A6M3LUK7_9ZZZZ
MPSVPKPERTPSQRGKAAKRKGSQAEREAAALLPGGERVPLSGSLGGRLSGDVTFGDGRYRAEVKVRARGFKSLYSWLRCVPGHGVQTIKRTQGVESGREKAPEWLFCRADNSPWLALCLLDELLVLLTENDNLRARLAERGRE